MAAMVIPATITIRVPELKTNSHVSVRLHGYRIFTFCFGAYSLIERCDLPRFTSLNAGWISTARFLESGGADMTQA